MVKIKNQVYLNKSLVFSTYYLEDDGFLRDCGVDSQTGDDEDANGEHPRPTHRRGADCLDLTQRNMTQQQNTKLKTVHNILVKKFS